MGVTAVGIHERAAHDKLATSEVARSLFRILVLVNFVFLRSLDVLNDEVQRKYISAVKRLMSHCQALHPTLPSLSVL